MQHARIGAVILAAGKSTRMRTEIPKVLHEVCGQPMLAYVLDACRDAGVQDCVVVVGYGKDAVINAFREDKHITWVEQAEQRGTGHAVMCCRAVIKSRFDNVFVLGGDGPLIRGDTLKELLKRHTFENAAVTLATSVLEDPAGYGRIVRNHEGDLAGIIEHNDCTADQRHIREVNPSYYCFKTPELLLALERIQPNNAKNEYYLTDTLAVLMQQNHKVTAITSVPAEDVMSINSRKELALVGRVLRDRILDRHMAAGVTIVDPTSTWIDGRAQIGQDTIIEPFVQISGAAKIGRNCRIGPLTHIAGQFIEDGVVFAGRGVK
jgi:bifunctional UDP-N-acetylglucosamine pyrophosphorylase / glucosamine-1-phosphate N-acetyltransferase